MKCKEYHTNKGNIIYWTNDFVEDRRTLVFLPGLTADHRLFDRQVAYFEDRCNVLVWDAPGHGASRPFVLDFSLADKAKWLHDIVLREGIERPVVVGQSMGGYVAQCYMQLFPYEVEAFVSIDSAPLQRKYMTGIEITLLKHTYWMYRLYPWKALLRDGAKGCAESDYGRQLMHDMMLNYRPKEYCLLADHGYKMLAEAVLANLPYEVDCSALLICGEKDKAGSAKRYNLRWAAQTGFPLVMIPHAGHNANTDQPEMVNNLIDDIINNLQ